MMFSSPLWRRGIVHRMLKKCKSLSRNSKSIWAGDFCIFHKTISGHRYFSLSSSVLNKHQKLPFDPADFPAERIRNFSIVAHIDHGKSTLADRLLEISGTITKGDNQQVLDRLQVERERGITVKAQTASMVVSHKGQDYLLNLIDTPGHVDFHYEVSRSLSACQGVILLVDANQGVQAQTVANFYLAFEAELATIPVINKIDLKNAKPEEVEEQMFNLFEFEPSDILRISAKNGVGIEDLIATVIEKIPCPQHDRTKPLKAFVFDSWYDQYQGVVAHLAIYDGVAKKGERITCASSEKTYEITEIGLMYPTQIQSSALYAGQVGYAMMNMRNTSEAQIGDTFFHEKKPVQPMKGFKPATPVVFAGIFPVDKADFVQLRTAIEKLTLNDRSVEIKMDVSPALGQGFRLGFLGLLHMDVFNQRLEQEYDASVIVTAPNVAYKVKVFGEKNIKQYRGEWVTVLNPVLMPDREIVSEYQEPIVKGTIISPDTCITPITDLCFRRRGMIQDQNYIDNTRVMFTVMFPLAEILVDFFDELKSLSSGYASFDYEDAGYDTSELAKVEFCLNGDPVEELTLITHASTVREVARRVCLKLKDSIPRQQFAIAVQAYVRKKVIAREDIKAYRKDVTAKCYGGDVTRKAKLLKRQAEGKKRMRQVGNIQVPKDAFVKVLTKM